MSPAAKGIGAPEILGTAESAQGRNTRRWPKVSEEKSRETKQIVGNAELKAEATIAVVIRAISRAVEIRDRTETATRPFVGG